MAKYIIRRSLVTAVLLLVTAAGVSGGAAAQETDTPGPVSQSALAVSPAIIEEVLTPGKPVEFTLQVSNVTNFPLPIKSFVRNLRLHSEEMGKAERARLDSSGWFTVTDPDFILQPNQVRTVQGTIKAPADAAPGGHYATIYFQPLVPEEALSPSMAYINARVGVLAFLVVKGDIEEKAALDRALQAPGLIRHGPIDFTFSIRNTGNVHLMPTGKLAIYDWRGGKVATRGIPTGLILPETTKQYTLEWDPPSTIGKYRAELTVGYGAEQVRLETTATVVWVVPWIELALGVVILPAVSIFILRTRRRWRRAWRALHTR